MQQNIEPRAAKKHMLDDLDIVKMTMTIKDKTVGIGSTSFDYLRIYEDQYKGLSEDSWFQNIRTDQKTEDFKAYVATLQIIQKITLMKQTTP